MHGKDQINRGYQKSKWYARMLFQPFKWFSQIRTQGCLLVTTNKLS